MQFAFRAHSAVIIASVRGASRERTMRGSPGLVKSIVWMRRIRFLNDRKRPLGELAARGDRLCVSVVAATCHGKERCKISVNVTSTAPLGSWLRQVRCGLHRDAHKSAARRAECRPRVIATCQCRLFGEVRVVRDDLDMAIADFKAGHISPSMAFLVRQPAPAFFHADRPKSCHRRMLQRPFGAGF